MEHGRADGQPRRSVAGQLNAPWPQRHLTASRRLTKVN
jgi:hypothetical protein